MVAAAHRELVHHGSGDDEHIGTLRSIEQRLHDGYAKIEEGRASGRNVARWELIWLNLLEEYEETFNRIAA